MRKAAWLVVVVACSSSPNQEPGAPAVDAPAADSTPPAPPSTLGTVTNVRRNITCPQGATGSCIQVTVSGCPGIESEALDAVVSILPGGTPSAGTILHFSGDDGTTFNKVGMTEYQQAGFLQVFVAWLSPGWELGGRWVHGRGSKHEGRRRCGRGDDGRLRREPSLGWLVVDASRRNALGDSIGTSYEHC